MSAEFKIGQRVRLKADPKRIGVVISVIPGKPENRFVVFMEGEEHTFYASQLEAVATPENGSDALSCDQFHSRLTALQIRYPGLSTLYSLNAARIDFIPYQFRPVLRFIRSDRPRLLIADGVGVGKTIEAGLILRELQARRDMRSILIICPRPLVAECKWEIEMKRFEENFVHLDSGDLRYCIKEMDLEGSWPERFRRIIVPYSLFDEALLHGSKKRKSSLGLLHLDPPPRFDLVIVDEAHHIRNPQTFRHKAVRFFCDHAEAVVFLTATPIQLGNQDLFVLLNTLRPDLVIDKESFEHMTEPNPFINQAVDAIRTRKPEWADKALDALNRAAETPWGRSILQDSPDFQQARDSLAGDSMDSEERVRLIADIESLHTFSGIINRTRRRDIGQFTTRKPETVRVEFTPSQKSLHDELLRVQGEILSRIHGDANINFMMTTVRRQAASCLFGLTPLLEDILNRRLDELPREEADDYEINLEGGSIDKIGTEIQSLLGVSRELDSKDDPKLNALRKIIGDKQELPNNKVMLFSSFLHTLRYLDVRLKADGFRVEMVYGGTPDEDRVALRNRFEMPRENPEALDVLLFSEIGCEGLDYQFCDCIVNYDLPWNPMRIEQRIGRIDRHGQQSEAVAIVNLITPGTIDADIYDRCLKRIGIFESAIGGGEEILGKIAKGIRSIADNLSLNEEDRKKRLQQLADNEVRLIQEQNKLEKEQLQLFGIELPQDQMDRDIERATSFWLSPKSIQRLVNHYLLTTCGDGQDYILGEKPLKTLRLSQQARNVLLDDFRKLGGSSTQIHRKWEEWLKGADQHLPITFESGCAMERIDAAFITPLHPLAKQAASLFEGKRHIFAALKMQTGEVPAGSYEFAIYQWRFHGIKEDLILKPVALSDAVTPHLPRLLEKAADDRIDGRERFPSSVCDKLEEKHYSLWNKAREQHQRKTRELAAYRRESLSTSHRARMRILEERIRQAGDDKIRRMRQSQIDSAKADYDRRNKEIDEAMNKADIIAEAVAYGTLVVENREKEHE